MSTQDYSYRDLIMFLGSLYNCDTPEKAYLYQLEEEKATKRECYGSIGDKLESLVLMEYGQECSIDKIISRINHGGY